MSRTKKKPNYNPENIMKELLNEVSVLYVDSEECLSIRQLAVGII